MALDTTKRDENGNDSSEFPNFIKLYHQLWQKLIEGFDG